MEKMIKIQEDSEKASREVELKIFEMEERRQKESHHFCKPQTYNPKSRTYMELQICKPKTFHVICTVQ